MKKIIILVVALAVLGGLGWYASSLMSQKGQSDTELIDFAIANAEEVDRVIISDPYAHSFELRKKNGVWTDKDGNCVQQESAEHIIDAIRNIEFKGYLPDNSHEQYTTLMSTSSTKVEIFVNEQWSKTWYIGPSAPDHLGQVMLLDSDEFGKSAHPVLMKIKGMNGIIEPRFFADPRKWSCTGIFNLDLNEIAMVDVKFNDEPERSFSVKKDGANMEVRQQGKILQGLDTANIFRYLNNYQKIHYNLANYELDARGLDSLKRSTPFAVLTVKETNGNATSLRLFRITALLDGERGPATIRDMDRDKLWCELPTGEVVKCQYFVFNPLLLGHLYFPMDVSMLKTEDGILEKEQ